jgi:hypothetical protein
LSLSNTLKLGKLMLSNFDDLGGKSYRIRTCDTLIERYKSFVFEHRSG